MDREARDKKKQVIYIRKKEGAKQTGQGNRNHNVILTEITPPHLLKDNKFATLLRILE